MKSFFILLLFLFTATQCFCQKKHIKQSVPFENLISAFENDSVEQLKKSFCQKILDDDSEKLTWEEKLIEGEKRFSERFEDLSISNFKFAFDKKKSLLIVYYKEKENIQLKVIKESGQWKLAEH